MKFEVTILGSSSASPAFNRNPTSQLLNYNERYYLIDCGEATQIQLNRYKLKSHRISHIFISHLHGDHYLGLMGLLSTLHLQGRVADLYLYCPAQLKEIIDLELKVSQSELRFKIVYRLYSENEEILLEDDQMLVSTILMNHRIPCRGFLFAEKKGRRSIDKERIAELDIPYTAFADLKSGKDYVMEDGSVLKNSELTIAPRAPRSFAYCSDTCYDENIIEKVRGVDLLYHESTFMHDLLPRAQETFHTTSLQAGQIAKKAEVKALLLGHFSARYKDLTPLLEEARTVFENTELGVEGKKFTIG